MAERGRGAAEDEDEREDVVDNAKEDDVTDVGDEDDEEDGNSSSGASV